MDDKTKGIGVERTSGRSDEYISGREALDTDGRIGERGTSRIPSRTTTGTTGSGSSSDTTRNLSTDAPTEERTREIRAEIEQTRGEMSETVNAIQDRLRPGNIASNAAESVKSSVSNAAESVKSSVKHATSDTTQVVSERAREMADSEPVQYVRANPIPTAMIGVGIAGLTWLMLGGREARSQNRYRSGRNSRDWRRLAPYNEGGRYYRGGTGHTGYTGQSGYTAESGFGDAGFGEVEYPGQGSYETAAAYDADLYQNRGSWRSGADYRGEYGGNYDRDRDFSRNRESSWAGQTGDISRRAQQTTAVAQRKVQRAWQQNPLMMGAASAVLGLIVGLAIPETEIENEYMGEARDNAVEGVQQSVRDTVQRVQDAASSAVGLVTGGSQSQSGSQGQQAQPGRQGSGSPAPQSGQSGSPAGQQSGIGTSGATTGLNRPESQGDRPGQANRPTTTPPKTTGNS